MNGPSSWRAVVGGRYKKRDRESLCSRTLRLSPFPMELDSPCQTFEVCVSSWALGLWTNKLSPESPSVRLPLGLVIKFKAYLPFIYMSFNILPIAILWARIWTENPYKEDGEFSSCAREGGQGSLWYPASSLEGKVSFQWLSTPANPPPHDTPLAGCPSHFQIFTAKARPL